MATVLKSDSSDAKKPAARSVTGLAGFNLSDLADEGRARLDECRSQIRQLLEEANHEAVALREEAERRGYEEGLARAAVDADKKLAVESEKLARDGIEVLHKAVGQMHQVQESWMQAYANSLTHIALSAAEKMVLHRLESEPEVLVRWAQEALQSTRSSSRLTLVVHPETLAQLGPALDELLASSDLPEQAHVEADESVERNGVIVRQNGGEIDAGLSAQLRRLEELLA